MVRLIVVLTVLTSMFSLPSCYYNNEEELLGTVICDTSAVKYSTVISTIVNTNCMPCHSTAVKEFGISLEGYTNLKANIEPLGRVLGAIRHTSGYFPMPKNTAQLSSCDISKMEKWVSEGGLNN